MTAKKVTNSVIETPRDDWSIDGKGYIHGGFDTPIFLQAKRKHNSQLTYRKQKIKIKKYLAEPRKYIQPVVTFDDPGFNRPESHPVKES